MRQASPLLRHVKLQQLLGPARCRAQPQTTPWDNTIRTSPVRFLAIPATAQRLPIVQSTSGQPTSTHENATSPATWRPSSDVSAQDAKALRVVSGENFGKWQALLYDPARLAAESDFSRRHRTRKLLVDRPENHGDLALWSCLLDFQKRVNGDAGVEKIWRALWNRKALFKTDGPLGAPFWQTILEAAVKSHDGRMLQNVYIYSEWMQHMHNAKWPGLYSTVIRHFLSAHDHQRAVQWHVRLFPNFDPGAGEFLSILRQFARNEELHHASTLQALYAMSPYRPMYDSMVPYLYNQGMSKQAMQWRILFVAHNDMPQQLAASRPFLRFLHGYFPYLHLSEEERSRVSAVTDHGEESPKLSRELVNRVHGQTFGITVKNYNDHLGSRWFATSWVSLDTAISTVAALGIEKIGPLSLQSIAVREASSEALLSRIEQLRTHGIGLPDGNFAKLLVHFAEQQLEDMYLSLLRSDFHPDVWDDISLQKRLIEMDSNMLDVKVYKLLLSANHYILQQSAKETANALVEAHFRERDWRGLLTVLEDMESMRIGLDRARARVIFQNLLEDISRDAGLHSQTATKTVDFYLATCKQLARMETPIPTRCWVRMLRFFGRVGRLDDLEELSVSLVTAYMNPRSRRPGFIPVHLDDLPQSMQVAFRGVEGIIGVYVPKDLPTQNPMHPLRRIFGPKMISSMVRWSFSTTLSHFPPHRSVLQRGTPGFSRSHYARVVSHLRLLKDRGLWVDQRHLARRIVVRLSYLYGPGGPVNRRIDRARAANTVPLAVMKTHIDEAWREELLPPLPQLHAQIGQLNPGPITSEEVVH